MGMTHVPVTVRNPAQRDRAWTESFLVDTGAFDSLVPRQHLYAIGLTPTSRRVYELADGSTITMDITVGEIEIMGEIVGGTIIFGQPETEPILGVTALESAGLEVDPQNQRLKRLPAVRLKAAATASSTARPFRRCNELAQEDCRKVTYYSV
jgi:clan AA aspartic protease